MTLSMYQASTPVFVHSLKALSAILGKAQAEVDAGRMNEGELIEARLAPDMFALPRQIQIAGDICKTCVAHLAGREPPVFPDEEKTLAELRERIAKTIAFLESVPAAEVDGSEARAISIPMRSGKPLEFVGQPFLLNFGFPNFFFHMSTAYGILRNKGLALTKQDFLGGA